IRGFHVTGVQTCALPIFRRHPRARPPQGAGSRRAGHRAQPRARGPASRVARGTRTPLPGPSRRAARVRRRRTSVMTGAPNPAPADALLQKLGGKWVVQALATAAELRLADVLTEPEPLSTLARKLACHPPALERLLRVLVGEGVL